MVFACLPEAVDPAVAKLIILTIGLCVEAESISPESLKAHTGDATRRPREVPIDHATVHAHGLEDLGASVARKSRDPIFGHDLEESLLDGLDIVANALLRGDDLPPARLVGHVSCGGEG